MGTKKSKREQQAELRRIYQNPLPIVFRTKDDSKGWWSYVCSLFTIFPSVEVPVISAVYDPASNSVWVRDMQEARILWESGFFGKGSLSRSEPTWLTREVNSRRHEKSGRKELTAEEVTAKRRVQRQDFKRQRAEAIVAAEAEAEKAFSANPGVAPTLTTVIPSAQTAGLNRFFVEGEDGPLLELTEEEMPENLEHLQLTLQEAFFLCWGVGCLRIINAETQGPLPAPDVWRTFLSSPLPFSPLSKRPDNPFLIQYVAYHHFRSLGWVVRSGIKFCVDYLLYKKGPIFAHAEFAVVVIPSYEDSNDRETSPYHLPSETPMKWSWFGTINRVNSQVMKTVVLAYVVIPAMSRLPVNPLDTPEVLSLFSVREVIVRRFVPARMRD